MTMPQPQQPRLNRSKNCRLCGTRGIRVQKSSPIRPGEDPNGHVDPDYVVAVCPTCDYGPKEPAAEK